MGPVCAISDNIEGCRERLIAKTMAFPTAIASIRQVFRTTIFGIQMTATASHNNQTAETFYPGKKVVITGGLGMLGSNLARALVDLGARVTIVDAKLKPYGANLFNIEGYEDRVTLIEADIRDRKAVDDFVAGQQLIFNFAGQISHNESIRDPLNDAQINYLGHLNVLESMVENSPHARIVYSGSRLQYGKVFTTPVHESHPLNPETPYAFNKTVAESMYRYYNRIHGIDSVLFRITNPYGIRGQMKHSQYGIVNHFLRLAMLDQEITIFGDGKQIRDYIYVLDIIDAFIQSGFSHEASGKVLNLGSGDGTSFSEMANLIVSVVGRGTVRHVPWPDHYINVETGDFIADISSARVSLNWSPGTSLTDGLQQSLEFYTAHRARYF